VVGPSPSDEGAPPLDRLCPRCDGRRRRDRFPFRGSGRTRSVAPGGLSAGGPGSAPPPARGAGGRALHDRNGSVTGTPRPAIEAGEARLGAAAREPRCSSSSRLCRRCRGVIGAPIRTIGVRREGEAACEAPGIAGRACPCPLRYAPKVAPISSAFGGSEVRMVGPGGLGRLRGRRLPSITDRGSPGYGTPTRRGAVPRPCQAGRRDRRGCNASGGAFRRRTFSAGRACGRTGPG
jgi:hypothetical protein